jgi:hypothetical protein
MRILVGPTEICGQINLFADGFRKLGHEVTTAVVNRNGNWWGATYDYDFTDRPFDLNRVLDVGYIFGSHDVFLYQWARDSFLPSLSDLSFLHAKGKKVISAFMGSDVRHYPTYAKWSGVMHDYIMNIPFSREPVANALAPLRVAELLSSIVLSQPNQSVLGVRPYHHLFIPVDVSKLQFHIPRNPVPRLLHVPSRRGVKGTELFLAACEELQREGLLFELRLVENVTNAQVLEEMRDADICLDELFAALHGKTAVEAMGSGCAVVSGDNFDLEPYPPERPLWCVRPWNLKEHLRELIINENVRIALAERGWEYVQRYHDHVTVCKRMLDILLAEDRSDKMHYPTLYTSGKYQLDESISAEILCVTDALILKYGLPSGVSIDELIRIGRISPTARGHAHLVQRWPDNEPSVWSSINPTALL